MTIIEITGIDAVRQFDPKAGMNLLLRIEIRSTSSIMGTRPNAIFMPFPLGRSRAFGSPQENEKWPRDRSQGRSLTHAVTQAKRS